jgi:threonine/homoserine/homoserine lactone efflux protein
LIGITLGLLTAGLLAAIGVAALIQSSMLFYQVIRIGGGVYLLWLAWSQWKEAATF